MSKNANEGKFVHTAVFTQPKIDCDATLLTKNQKQTGDKFSPKVYLHLIKGK